MSKKVPSTKASGKTVRDQVALILQGLQLDKSFFLDKLQSDSAQKLLPQDPDAKDGGMKSPRPSPRSSLKPAAGKMAPPVGTGFRRRPSMVARRFPDFDIYLTESLLPVLVQALDALCRQVAYMEKQGNMLDARVRARFNPVTWLAQQLLRRHPRVATTPRRLTIYRSFRDWADQERGRRELLRSRSKILEVFNGFMQKGAVGRNSLPFVLNALDDVFCLRGALKDNKEVQNAVLEGQLDLPRRGSRLGGEGITFDRFWFKFANAIVKHDVVTYSMIMEGRKLQKLKEEEHEQLMEAARQEEERLAEERAKLEKLKKNYEALYPRLVENEALKAILDGKVLSGEFLKPTDPAFESEVAPHGPHVQLLADVMLLLGLEIATEETGVADLEAGQDDGSGNRLFRAKLDKSKIEKEEEEEAAEKEKKKSAKKQEKEKEKEERPAEEQKGQGDRWWDPSMTKPFKILQVLCKAEPNGIVDQKVLRDVIPPPDKFIELKKKVESELERKAERAEVDDDGSVEGAPEVKPTMEELSQKYGIAKARLDFFHDLFTSFLPPNEDGSPGVCGYPENPACINKKTMFLMLKEIQANLNEAEFEARFRRIDGDGSGLIEFDEFVQWVYDDEVEVVGGAEKVKRTFEELANDMDVSVKLIEYCYMCFKEELDADVVDNYPSQCAILPREQACTLAQILVTTLDKKRFDRYWDTVDVQNKGAVTFDDFLELLDFEDMPEETLAKYNQDDDAGED